LFASCLYAAEDRIGYIDTRSILLAHPKYEAAQKTLDAFVQKKSDTAKAAADKETDAAKKRDIIDKARRESGEEELRVMKPINDDIDKALSAASKTKGVTVVLEKVYIYFGGVDLTDDVVAALKKIK
jgi:outer membrane protein